MMIRRLMRCGIRSCSSVVLDKEEWEKGRIETFELVGLNLVCTNHLLEF